MTILAHLAPHIHLHLSDAALALIVLLAATCLAAAFKAKS